MLIYRRLKLTNRGAVEREEGRTAFGGTRHFTVRALRELLKKVPDEATVGIVTPEFNPDFITINWCEEMPEPPTPSTELDALRSEVESLRRLVNSRLYKS